MFNEYPYTDFHEMNTDWIISKIKNVETAEANTKQYAEDADAAKVAAEDAKDIAVQAKDDAVGAKNDAESAAASVADTRQQIDLLQARVDNIIPDGTQTAGNTELLDIRVGYNGYIYDSAGNAVRDQIIDIKNKVYNLKYESKNNYKLYNKYQLWDIFEVIQGEYIRSDGSMASNDSAYHIRINVTQGETYYFATPDPSTSTGVKAGNADYVCFIKTDDTYYDVNPTAHTNVSSITIPADVDRMIVSVNSAKLYEGEYSIVTVAAPTNTSANPWSPRYINYVEASKGSNINISCIGDSLTEGSGGGGVTYPDVLASNNPDIKVYKFAYPSEDSMYISYVTGAQRLTADPFVIPASNSGNAAPTIVIRTENNSPLIIDHVGSDNLCMISGVLGWLKYENGVNKFQRFKPGVAINVDRPANIQMCFELKHYGDICIIWSGTNDTAIASVTDPIFYHIDNIIKLLPHKKYLVIGVMDKVKFPNIDSINVYYRRRYGNHFVNIRQYLMDYGLDDAGITPTQQDETDITNGLVPTSLRSDQLHLNAAGYTVVGNYLYKLITDNNWLE